jgi:hypothetical protein
MPVEAPDAPEPVENVVTGQLLAVRRLRKAAKAGDKAAKRAGLRLFNVSALTMGAALAYLSLKANVADPLHLYLGQIMFVLAVLPALVWAKRGEYGLPLFEAFMLPGLNTFAIPLLNGHQTLQQYSPETITTAAFAVAIFQAAAVITYFTIKAPPKRGRVWRTEIVSRDMSRLLGYGMIITTIYTVAVQFTDWIPNALAPEIRAVCYGIGIVATFVQSRRWGDGTLPHHDKAIFVIQLLLQVIFSWVALFLVQGVSILLLSLIGYISGSRRIPFIPILIALPIIGVLYNGKATMRAKYWDAQAPQPTIAQVPAFFNEWVTDGLASQQDTEAAKSAGVLDRTSLIQIMCLVASISPDKKPFLDGETYLQIPGQFIPRFFWPDKPLGHISTYTLTLYYGLQGSMEEAQQTTIGFGMVAESYANFGLYGTAMIGIFFGLFFKKATGWTRESPIFSYPGLFTVVLMAWTFQTELPLSAWLASLWQACICVLGLPMFLKNFFK